MKQLKLLSAYNHVICRIVLPIIGSLTLLSTNFVYADLAVLVDEAVLVERNPITDPEDPQDPEEPVSTSGTNASYVSSGGWATTGATFIDAAVVVFDFANTESVAQATLSLPLEEVYLQNGSADLQVYLYADNGVIEVSDYSIGFSTPIAELDAAGLTQIDLDVTGAVNSALSSGRYVAFRIQASIAPELVNSSAIPAWAGVKFSSNYSLQFTSGSAPVVANDSARFDGFTLEVPNIEVPGIGEAAVQLKMVDPNQLLFELTASAITGAGVSAPPISGIDLLDCSAFSPPPAAIVIAGNSTYSTNSGILDVPSVNYNNQQLAFRLEYIEGSNPWMFETLSIKEVQTGLSQAALSALGGGLLAEPSQDFVPLCHGWVLIGDSVRNRVVERNLLSGETGATYPFGTIPDQFTLDEANGAVYMTVHPETERIYRLDLNTGLITSNHISQTLTVGPASHTYNWTLRDLALGEDGNLFALMVDNIMVDPENSIPYSDTGFWMGLLDSNGAFLAPSFPLDSPLRIEYDKVRNHVFLATQSNLATFDFDAGTNAITIIPGTDISVGSACTDFSISPDGNRLAYSCPNGNRSIANFSIVDMSPTNYFDSDGEWYLGSSPVSATFNNEGTILIATDNEKLYFYDVVTHLILEDFELGLVEGEQIQKIRVSLDGQYLIIYLQNALHDENSKFYWMPMPAITGTPL